LKPEDLDELSQHYAQGQVIHGGADVNAVDVDGHAAETGDHGKNSTGNKLECFNGSLMMMQLDSQS
jgi:hypothetical protein